MKGVREVKRLEGFHRNDVIELLDRKSGCVGVELGVAGGEFSRRMVRSGRFSVFFGVDMYADTHDVAQYKEALAHVGLFEPYKLLRMTFSEALDLFEDESLDFIYVDGYAHSGEEGGETIWEWARKVRIGGVISGDDYHADWPLVVEAVESFASQTGFEVCITTETEDTDGYSCYPSWAMIKHAPVKGVPPSELVKRGKSEGRKVARKRQVGQRLDAGLQRLLGPGVYSALRDWNRARKSGRRKG